MFPEPPAPDAVPSCAEAGVIGALPGVIGSLQAMEAIKLIAGLGEPPLGKMIHYDALRSSFRTMSLRRDPECALCGENQTQTGLIDYEGFCGVPGEDSGVPEFADVAVRNTTVLQLAKTVVGGVPEGVLVLDVREANEYASGHITGSVFAPLSEGMDAWVEQCCCSEHVYVICKAGGRSLMASKALRDAGVHELINVVGGMDAWKAAKLPMEEDIRD